MEKFIKTHRFLSGLLSIVISVFLVSIVAYGATTIGTNIQTAGTASSTSATTTDYLYVGEDIDEPAGIDFSGGDLIVSGLAYFHTKATSTTAFAVGAGTIDYLDMAGGDLYVQGDVEIDGLATSTEGFYSMGALEIGGDGLIRGNITAGNYVTSTASINTQGTLHVGGAATIDGSLTVTSATSSNFFVVGSPTPTSADYDGDLMVEDDVEIGGWASTTEALNTQGNLHVGGNITFDGRTTTTDYIYLPMVHFQQGVATSTAPNEGECFMPKNDLTCYADGAWVYAW